MDQKKFSAAAKDFRSILPRFKMQSIWLAGETGSREPVVTDTEVVFNERSEASYERFDIKLVYSRRDLHPDRPMKWDSCKTDRRPYDLAVMCCLIIFKHHFRDDFLVQSNGEIKDWEPAISLVSWHLGYTEKWGFMEDKNGEPHLAAHTI